MSDQKPEPENSFPPAGKRHTVSLKNLFLDPNNFRFIDQQEYVKVPENKITDPDVQRRTTSFILGRNNEEVKDLIGSFKKNGWLPVDQIQVRPIGQSKYVVVEGNRRVACLKLLERRYEEGAIDLGSLDPSIFRAVPVVFYEAADEAHHLVVMGLGHISGKKHWPTVNQARLLKNLISISGWSEEDVCNAVGVKRRELRATLKTLTLSELYAESDYGDQFSPEKFNIFREIVRSREISKWLDLSDSTGRPRNLERAQRLFSWLSTDEDFQDSEDDFNTASPDPVISKGSDVRDLAKIITDEKALRTLDETRRLTEATLFSDVIVQDRIETGLTKLNDNLSLLFNYSSKLTEKDTFQLESASKKLKGLLASRDIQPRLLGERKDRRTLNQVRSGHFKSINLTKFKRFENLEISELRQINLFLGPNNTGKTSLLEGVNLLTAQNDIDELLRTVVRRGKLNSDPPPTWIRDQIESEIIIKGRFDNVPDNVATVSITNETSDDDSIDKTFYITSLEIEAWYGGQKQTATTHIFENRDRITRMDEPHTLCPVVFSSPFTQHDTEFLTDLFNRSVLAKTKDLVIDFIRENLDSGFRSVDAKPGHNNRNFTRFQVTHDKFDSAVDLTQFGEGIQRIFQIGLLFAYAESGIVLIDEFENAIHYSLLKPFTKFVRDLSRLFRVQVFITSHSKECLEAFMSNGEDIHEISAYAMRLEEGSIRSYHYSAERLERMLESLDIDLRGVQSPTNS